MVEPKPEAKPKPKPQRPPAPSVEKIVEAAVEGVTRAMDQRAAAAKPSADKGNQEPELPVAERRKIEVLAKMEELYPDQYKGVSKKYADGIAKAMQYAANWEKENPGEEFDENSPEHEEFFEANKVDWKDEDYSEALIEVKVAQRLPKVAEQIESKVNRMERQEQLRSKEKVIDTHQALTARNFFSRLGEEYADLINEDGSVNKEKMDEFKANNPVAYDLAVGAAAQHVEPIAAEIFKLMDGLEDYDPKRPDHAWINSFAINSEQMMLRQPEEKQLNESGQRFATAEEYGKMTEAQQKRHWTFSAVELSALAADFIATETSKKIELEHKKHEAWAKARGLNPQQPSGKTEEDDADERLENPRGKPVSPEATAEPKMARRTQQEAAAAQAPKNAFLNKLLG